MFKIKIDIDHHGPRPMPTTVKILTHLIFRYHLPLIYCSRKDSEIAIHGAGGGGAQRPVLRIYEPRTAAHARAKTH